MNPPLPLLPNRPLTFWVGSAELLDSVVDPPPLSLNLFLEMGPPGTPGRRNFPLPVVVVAEVVGSGVVVVVVDASVDVVVDSVVTAGVAGSVVVINSVESPSDKVVLSFEESDSELDSTRLL